MYSIAPSNIKSVKAECFFTGESQVDIGATVAIYILGYSIYSLHNKNR